MTIPLRQSSIDTMGQAMPAGALGESSVAAAYLDGLDHGLVLIDREGRVRLCSAKARRLLHLDDADAALGRTAFGMLRRLDLGTAAHRHDLMTTLREPLRQGSAASIELEVGGHALSIMVKPLPECGWAVTIEDQADHLAALNLRSAAAHDGLTGLPNRASFGARLDEARGRLERTGEGFAVLAINLDRFKSVNDTLGHPVGDALLRVVADRLRSLIRPSDGVARLGGDEFIVLQSGVANGVAAEALAERIVDLLGRAYVVGGHLINVGASVGVTLAPADGTEADRLLKNADLALCRAKIDGRNTQRFFEAAMEETLKVRRLLEIDLRRALALREFELHYQPQLNLDTDRLIGCEALIRWRHPTRGLVSPLDFIPLAEEIGLIVPIGEWVVRTACKEAVRWPGDVTVAVNLSPAQFKSKKLFESIVDALRVSGLAPHRLELEITEGVLLQDNDANLATLHALRRLGLRISMDDFGTGYSSLSYLRSFPFDKIKIDRSFIREVETNADCKAIVRAIASLGASFGMTTVAEGVETTEQMRRIRDEGCDDVQGYLISRPIPAADIMRLLVDRISQATSGAAVS